MVVIAYNGGMTNEEQAHIDTAPKCNTCYDTGEIPTPKFGVYDPCLCQTIVVTEYDLREGGVRYTTRKIKSKARREWPEFDVARETEIDPDGTERVVYDRATDPRRLEYLQTMANLAKRYAPTA